jgi:4a-hydroxytetrahydrobiopterin dehydratase
MTERLTDEQIDKELSGLPAWVRSGDALQRTVQAADFPTAIRIVDDIAAAAESAAHHPDIDIRWRTLHLTLSTHSAGGITGKDARLAARIDEIAREHGA